MTLYTIASRTVEALARGKTEIKIDRSRTKTMLAAMPWIRWLAVTFQEALGSLFSPSTEIIPRTESVTQFICHSDTPLIPHRLQKRDSTRVMNVALTIPKKAATSKIVGVILLSNSEIIE